MQYLYRLEFPELTLLETLQSFQIVIELGRAR